MSVISPSSRRLAVILGVANHRSIAWACVQSFLQANYDCIVTYQSERFRGTLEKLAASTQTSKNDSEDQQEQGQILACLPVNVETDLPQLFDHHLPSILHDNPSSSSKPQRQINSIVHSIAYADFELDQTRICEPSEGRPAPPIAFHRASAHAFAQAHIVSSYSLLETARCAVMNKHGILAESASLTALTYLGAIRAVPNYHIMGPAKASLEAVVRGLALDLGKYERIPVEDTETPSPLSAEGAVTSFGSLRVNAVSAAPLQTLAARGIPHFSDLYQKASQHNCLQRPITAHEVANTVRFLASEEASGITGQVIYVDGGYSNTVVV